GRGARRARGRTAAPRRRRVHGHLIRVGGEFGAGVGPHLVGVVGGSHYRGVGIGHDVVVDRGNLLEGSVALALDQEAVLVRAVVVPAQGDLGAGVGGGGQARGAAGLVGRVVDVAAPSAGVVAVDFAHAAAGAPLHHPCVVNGGAPRVDLHRHLVGEVLRRS